MRQKLKKDVLLLDGAFGTYIQTLGLSEQDFRDRPGCMEYLVFTKPVMIEKLHSDYLEAGADAVETDTFGANAIKLSEYGLGGEVFEINRSAALIARKCADRFSTPSSPRYVAGSMGPTGKLPSSTDPILGDISYGELKKVFFDQAKGLIAGGVDAIIVETSQDLLEIKAAINGAREAAKSSRRDVVLFAQFTLANHGRMLLGTEVSAAAASLGYLAPDVIGINCSAGPLEMEQAVAYLSENCPAYISCIPNAGLPIKSGDDVVYPLSAGEMGDIVGRFVKKYGINVVGGCCGTTPEHIKAIRKNIGRCASRKIREKIFFSGSYNAWDILMLEKPVQVGERINTQGSKKMKEMLLRNDIDGIVELGKSQEKLGARVLDVCTVLTERSTEKEDTVKIMKLLAESVQPSLMIDSTNPDVIEAALSNYPGTAFINSVNMEDGGEKADHVFALAREHGSFVVALVIDEKGMAKTVEHKLSIARKLRDIAASYGLKPQQILFDMLTFSLGTGEEEYKTAAVNTFEAIKKVKKDLPGVMTVLGVSNISFGLPPAGRKILNAAFLHHAVKNGLDFAIVNVEAGLDYNGVPKNEKKLAEDLLFNRDAGALMRFVEYFSAKTAAAVAEKKVISETLSPEEKIKRCVFERNRSAIIPLLDELVKTRPAEDIINHVLMSAMREVGEKLDKGELVLPYVLQSAEVMRSAIEYLERFLPAGAGAGKRGRVLLATVFGDVHDIGKNLVRMVLQNNGFEVIDLGKQVPVEKIVSEAKSRKVDIVGLSALLVSTARYMQVCVQALNDEGINCPIMIGGAPTNEQFASEISVLKDKTIYPGGVFHSKDVFQGLKIAQFLMDDAGRKDLVGKFKERTAALATKENKAVEKTGKSNARNVVEEVVIPVPPFIGIRSIPSIPIDVIFDRLDEEMLFNVGWGLKLKDKKEEKAVIEKEYRGILSSLKEEGIRSGWFDLAAVYGYFKCRVEGAKLRVMDSNGKTVETLDFSRGADMALTAYFSRMQDDVVAFQAVTVGSKVGAAIDKMNERKEVNRAFLLHGLSVHLAEALADYVSDRIRIELKLSPDQGKRYSPGFALWKNMEDQIKIFKLLDVTQRIGVRLTEACLMVPEQSTTAMFIHNKAARY
ncbi:MAG TPA: homocysteine S-methyltransferase family protein [Candidatus Omnitrophota bacterium]|nr:homocysteine S-methyltransferase family protein [Candidatus Omnitrophota bacterium]HPS21103.1 homocysteine S-methyltransferase family protein [Candidatus Omnitrophota bacterium]